MKVILKSDVKGTGKKGDIVYKTISICLPEEEAKILQESFFYLVP